MDINEKIKNAKTTDWLSEGLTDNKIRRIKVLALISASIKLMFRKCFKIKGVEIR